MVQYKHQDFRNSAPITQEKMRNIEDAIIALQTEKTGLKFQPLIDGQYDMDTGIPTIKNPEENVIYLVPNKTEEEYNLFIEWIYLDNKWEKWGSAEIDLIDLKANNSISVNRDQSSSIGIFSLSVGDECIASGEYSTAFGHGSEANGEASFACGDRSIASGVNSHAEGEGTTASGDGAHSEGNDSTASGRAAHAEGGSTESSGNYSHAEGNLTKAQGEYSHSEGEGTIASGFYQHVQGQYNIEDENSVYADIIGNGQAGERSNAHTLDWEGNAWFSGDVYVGSTSGTNKDDGSKRLVTTEDIKNLVLYTERERIIEGYELYWENRDYDKNSSLSDIDTNIAPFSEEYMEQNWKLELGFRQRADGLQPSGTIPFFTVNMNASKNQTVANECYMGGYSSGYSWATRLNEIYNSFNAEGSAAEVSLKLVQYTILKVDKTITVQVHAEKPSGYGFNRTFTVELTDDFKPSNSHLFIAATHLSDTVADTARANIHLDYARMQFIND